MMRARELVAKTLATTGTVLAWFPTAATLGLAAAGSLASGAVRFDYLMPAELFPAGLAGGALLLVGALLARARRALIGLSLGLAVTCLVGGQALAVVTGLASGEIEPAGWPWAMVLASLALYALALVAMGIGGILLLRDLFGPRAST
jgi:hypothetical protein